MDILIFVNLLVPMDGTEIIQPDYVYNNVQYNLFYLLTTLQILVSNIVLLIKTFLLIMSLESVFFIVVSDYLLKFNRELVSKLALKIS